MLTKDQKYLVRKLRAEYAEDSTALKALWDLDAKIKKPARKAALVCAILGVLLIVLNMIAGRVEVYSRLHYDGQFFMYETAYTLPFLRFLPIIPSFEVLELIVFLLHFGGPILAMAAYPVYWLILKARKKKYVFEMLHLTDELLND